MIIGVHVFFLCFIVLSPTLNFQKKDHKPLIIKTMSAQPTSIKTNHHSTQQIIRPTQKPAAPKQQPSPKQEIAKPQTQKQTPSPKKEPAIADKKLNKTKQAPVKTSFPPTQNRSKISDSLIKELEESIAKIENKSDKETASNKSAGKSKTLVPIRLQIDTPSVELSNREEGQNDYRDVLISHLHECLVLPDYGEVKIQLGLREDGTVVKVIVLKTQSEKNRQYLESNLPRLKFPRFDKAYAGKKECTFTLTFCNE